MTGSLGSSLLSTLLSFPRSKVRKVICLVRAADDEQAFTRTRSAIKERELEVDFTGTRVEFYAADLALTHLGLEEGVWKGLVQEVDIIVHVSGSEDG